jgi:hypothetical protein
LKYGILWRVKKKKKISTVDKEWAFVRMNLLQLFALVGYAPEA